MENKSVVQIEINGRGYRFEIDSGETLLDVIRERAGLTGTKRGCDSGHCGACTVLLDGAAVNSCCVLALQADGRRVETVESLSRDGVHPIQQAFVDENAIQCGYCIPGMEMATKALLDREPDPTDEQIREALAGNLCRCTGYVKIERAVRRAARTLRGAR